MSDFKLYYKNINKAFLELKIYDNNSCIMSMEYKKEVYCIDGENIEDLITNLNKLINEKEPLCIKITQWLRGF